MRLNFAGVSEDDLREGIRRIGKVVSEQVGLYSTLTGVEPVPRRHAGSAADAAEAAPTARVLPLRRQAGGER